MEKLILNVVLVHSLLAMIGAVGCILSAQLGLSLAFLILSFVFFIIARKIEEVAGK